MPLHMRRPAVCLNPWRWEHRYINGPLRNQKAFYEKQRPHPLPVLVGFISEAVKKLRAAYAQNQGDQATVETRLWRGMKNLDIQDDFLQLRKGGTELVCASRFSHYRVRLTSLMLPRRQCHRQPLYLLPHVTQ